VVDAEVLRVLVSAGRIGLNASALGCTGVRQLAAVTMSPGR
jgi:hypothetical protein